MTQVPVTFELWVDDFRRRALDSVFDEMDTATSAARKLFRERRLKSVEVERVTLRRLGTEERKVVYADRRQDERKQVSLSADFDSSVLCDSVDDIYETPALIVIGRVLRGYLDHQGITALELLHDPHQAQRLNNDSSLRSRAISLVAAAQARESDHDVDARRDALEALADDVISRMRALAKKSKPVDLTRGLARACPMDSYYDDFRSRQYTISAALTRHIGYARSWGHKLSLLLDLIVDDVPAFALDLVDRFVADIFRSTAAVRSLCGERKDLAPALTDLAHLGRGRLAQTYDTSPALESLNGLIAAGRLPVTLAAITDRIVQGLDSKIPLVIEERGSQFEAFFDIVGALKPEGGTVFGGTRMTQALALRWSRFAQTEVDRRLTGCRKPAKQIETLFELARQAYGGRGVAIVLENLETVIDGSAKTGSLIPDDCALFDGLRLLAEWQRRVEVLRNGSGEVDDAVDSAMAALDRATVALLSGRNFLENLTADHVSASSKLETMLMLCRSGVLTNGRAADLFRSSVIDTIRQPAFLADLNIDTEAGMERDPRIRKLMRMLDNLEAA